MRNGDLFHRIFKQALGKYLLITSALIMSACASAPAVQQLDFGTPMVALTAVNAGPSRTLQLSLASIEVPISLDGNAMLYRLAYDSPQALRPYATNNWSMPPAQLLAQQLKLMSTSRGIHLMNQQDGVKNIPQLRLELIEFAQLFASAEQSQATVIFRASLVHKNNLIAQRLFSGKADAGGNAQSGARAMHLASQDALQQLLTWASESDFSSK